MTETKRICGIKVAKRWSWTRERHAEEAAAIRALLKPMGDDCPFMPLPGDDVDEQGRLIRKRIGP